jgi:IS5 family transposase
MAEGDTAYRSKANEDFMEKQGFVSKVHRKKPQRTINQRFFDPSRFSKQALKPSMSVRA